MNWRRDVQMEEMRQSHQIEIMSLWTQIDQITSFLCDFAPHQGPDASSSYSEKEMLLAILV
ncbi:hypothetical protein COCNU_scaffold012088G000020 [Cocos nucifera]|nr:hypothetical protein [Cocos nucifera]